MLGGRVGAKGWQFPQGGMIEGEEPVDAMFRELREEVGLEEGDVDVLDVTSDWLRYKLPDKFIRRHSKPLCIGQKQPRALHELGSCVHPDGLPPQPRWWPRRWRSVFDKDLAAVAKKSGERFLHNT
jgi:putative (di)nucleoside polyphosphate hydrolase